MPEFLEAQRYRLELLEGVPTVTLLDTELSDTDGWSVLNRATVVVVDGPGDEGFLLARLTPSQGDRAPAGWDEAVDVHNAVVVRSSRVTVTAPVVG
jgi:hypothetical protein